MHPNYSPAREDLPFGFPDPCFLLRGVVDTAGCDALVARAEAMGIGRTGSDYPPSYRDNDRLVFDDPALARELFERVRALLPARHGEEWRLARLNPRFRVCRYTNGQSFRVHRDGAYAAGDGARSWLTLQIYLNDASAFRGGSTRFYASRAGACVGGVRPEAGMAVVFGHDLWHDGEAVPAGTKYVLRTDVVYERDAPRDAGARDAGILREHRGYVFAIAPLAAGGFATGSRDRTIRVWERAASGIRCTRVLDGHAGSVIALAEARPGILWSGARDHTLRAWSLATGESRVIGAHEGAVLSIAPLGADIVGSAGADARVRLWTRDGEPRGALSGHTGWVWSLARMAEGRAVSASEDGTLRLWDLDAHAAIDATAPGRGPVHAVTFVREGCVAAGFADGSVVLYSVHDDRLAPTQVIDAHRGEIYALAAIDGRYVASGGEDEAARVHRIADGGCCAETKHDGFVRAVAPLGDGVFASGGYDETVRIWTADLVTAAASSRSTAAR